MFGLVDCNTFYASCERAFNPALRNLPVVVLSNNDGCAIAMSKEAKALGIKMGVPAFKIEEIIKKHKVAVFSSNYTLYGDMSNRVMTVLSCYTPNIEIYSIDEAFLDLSGFDNLAEYGREIVRTTTKWTGIPVSMGIGQTKTLAKVANKFAKKHSGYKGVCVIDTEDKRIKALKLTKIGDVWGIGRQHEKRLLKMGVENAYQFTELPLKWIRKEMTVVGERLWKELNGESCIPLELIAPDKKQICTTRAFGEMQSDIEGLREAVSTYAGICAQKLRDQKGCAVSLMVIIHTNNFIKVQPQHFANCVVNLPVPSNSTFDIVHAALEGLEKIYKKGYRYKKAGVIIMEIVPDNAIQGNLFETTDRIKHKKVMDIMDKLNSGFNNNALNLAIQGNERKWQLRREHLSNRFSTDLNEIIKIS